MSDETKQKDEPDQKNDETSQDERVTDAETAFEEYAGDKECPECGEPIIEVRANCPNCGYEYKDSDYGDKEAGSEFVAGSAVDDEGNEMPDDPSATGEQEEDDGAERSDDE